MPSHSSSQWFLRTNPASGDCYGPVSTEGLLKWAKDGKVMPDDEVSGDKSGWTPAKDVDFLMKNDVKCVIAACGTVSAVFPDEEMEKRGILSERAQKNREIKARNQAKTLENEAKYMHELKEGYALLDKEVAALQKESVAAREESRRLRFRAACLSYSVIMIATRFITAR